MRSKLGLAAVVFAVLFLTCGGAKAGSFSDLQATLKTAKSDAQVVEQAKASGLAAKDPELSDILSTPGPDQARQIKGLVNIRAVFDQNDASNGGAVEIRKVTNSAAYRKAVTPATTTNWLGTALQKLSGLIDNSSSQSRSSSPNLGFIGGLFQFLTPLVWTILGAALIAFVLFAVRAFRLRANKRTQVKAMLDDSEPERSLDEWLVLAESLEREGRFREAVRCLFLACLMNFDQYKIGRFDRTETNWEHLRRLTRSPDYPSEFNLRLPTEAFDRVWYGGLTNGNTEVLQFKAWYQELTKILSQRKVVQ